MNKFNMFDDANFDVIYHLAKSGGDVELITAFIKDNKLKFTPDIDLTNNTLLTMLFCETGDVQRYFDDHYWRKDEYFKRCIDKKPVVGINDYLNRLVTILAAYHIAQNNAESPDFITLAELLKLPWNQEILSDKDFEYLKEVAVSKSHSSFAFDNCLYKHFEQHAVALITCKSLFKYFNVLHRSISNIDAYMDSLFMKIAFFRRYGDYLSLRVLELNSGFERVVFAQKKELDDLMLLLNREAVALREEIKKCTKA